MRIYGLVPVILPMLFSRLSENVFGDEEVPKLVSTDYCVEQRDY